eukprot:scaffold73748_cov69-Phaeocystis_antarctica.AAC.4
MHHATRERHEHVADVLQVLRVCGHLARSCGPCPAHVVVQREQRQLEGALLRRAWDAGLWKHGNLYDASPAPSAMLDVEAQMLAAPDLRVHLRGLAGQPLRADTRRVLCVVHRSDVGLLDENNGLRLAGECHQAHVEPPRGCIPQAHEAVPTVELGAAEPVQFHAAEARQRQLVVILLLHVALFLLQHLVLLLHHLLHILLLLSWDVTNSASVDAWMLGPEAPHDRLDAELRLGKVKDTDGRVHWLQLPGAGMRSKERAEEPSARSFEPLQRASSPKINPLTSRPTSGLLLLGHARPSRPRPASRASHLKPSQPSQHRPSYHSARRCVPPTKHGRLPSPQPRLALSLH